MAERHHRLWQWFSSLEAGSPPPRPRVEGWPRGGAKSTTVELGVTFLSTRLSRRFVLYVSGTQDQADAHVQSIATMLEQIGTERHVGKYGNSKGWRRNQLRTDTGFNVVAIGLDTAARGMKLDEFRPDLIVFDDIDEEHDTPKTVRKKVSTITKGLIPAGSSDTAILVVQNLIHEGSIMAQLVDGRADWLSDREVFHEPAVVGLEYEAKAMEDGRSRWVITKGSPTWEGQDLEVCAKQMNEWGLTSFLQESQHDIYARTGRFFNSMAFVEANAEDLNHADIVSVARAWDTAATQGGGDYTAGVLIARTKNGVFWVLDVIRAQLGAENVKSVMNYATAWDRMRFGPKYTVLIPRDPGAAGKRVAAEDSRTLGAQQTSTQGKKAKRAEKWAEEIGVGNVRLVHDKTQRGEVLDNLLQSLTRGTAMEGKTGPGQWIKDFVREHREFREDETHEYDDQVDAAADAHKACSGQKPPVMWLQA